MKEQLITFETAKVAKDKGFKLGIGWHGFEDMFYYQNVDGGELTENHRGDNLCAPTQSLLQKWLREEHNIHLTVQYSKHWEGYQWRYDDWRFREENPDMRRSTYTNSKTYEEALEKGLQEALKLIK